MERGALGGRDDGEGEIAVGGEGDLGYPGRDVGLPQARLGQGDGRLVHGHRGGDRGLHLGDLV